MNKWLILSAIIILEGAAERFRKTHGKFNYCKWTVGNGRYKLDGGGHSFGKCKNKCIERGDECNYMTFFHGTGYCHQFKSCNMPSLRKDGGATMYIKEAGTGWTMTEKIWNDGQCPNIGGKNGKTLRQCKQLCTNRAGCTAFNYSPTVANGACIFRKCGNVVPTPKKNLKGYNGYHMDYCGGLKDELPTATCKEMFEGGKCAEQIILSMHLCKKTCNPHICNQWWNFNWFLMIYDTYLKFGSFGHFFGGWASLWLIFFEQNLFNFFQEFLKF